MARPYSTDLRERVKRAVESGGYCRQASAQFEVSVSFVVKLMQRWRQQGTLTARPMGGRKPQRLAAHGERVRALIAGEPDLTIDALQRRLGEEGIAASRSAVGRTLLALGLTRKKRRRARANSSGRTSRSPAAPGSSAKPS